MHKEYFLKLLKKYHNGTATAEEQQCLEKFYDAFASEADVMELMGAVEREALKKNIQGAIWQQIRQRQQQKNVFSLNFRSFRKVAAAVLVLFCAGGAFFLVKNRHSKSRITSQVKVQHPSNVYLALQDGSRVILSHGSKLTYAKGFGHLPTREVYLIGKAYFDVKHDSHRPFIVHTGNLFTTVLGTAFNIEAIPGDKLITVTVTRGKVKVNDQNNLIGVIVPNQQIVYNKRAESATKIPIVAAISTGWATKSDLYLEDVTVAEAAILFEERFKVKIVFSDDHVKNKRFTTSFDSAASLDKALKSICAFNDATYSFNKENNLITINAKTN